MSWVTIVVIVVASILVLGTMFLVWVCCRMSSLAGECEGIECPWTSKRIADAIEDFAYQDGNGLSGVAFNSLLKVADYYKTLEGGVALPILQVARCCTASTLRPFGEEALERYILFKGVSQNEVDEAKGDIVDLAASLAMREVEGALRGILPLEHIK
jgi:hypothetical protein